MEGTGEREATREGRRAGARGRRGRKEEGRRRGDERVRDEVMKSSRRVKIRGDEGHAFDGQFHLFRKKLLIV